MSIRKKLLQLVFPLVLALGISASPAAAVGNVALADKGDYEDSLLYVDLDLLPDDVTDDGNFVVMKEGAVILYKDSSSTMRLEVSQDKTTYTLLNPTEAAKGILPGTPVAFVDKAAGQAAFFLPTHVAAGADQIVFTCSPEYVKAEQLFSVAAITGNKTFKFGQELKYNDDVLDFQGHLAGTYNVNFSYNMNTYEMEATVSYDLTGAELKVKQNFEQEISLDNLVFTGFSGVDRISSILDNPPAWR